MNFNTPLFGLGGFDTGDTPSATLHISGAGNTTLFVEGDITSSGTGKFEKVGIGAPTPSLGLLHISGSGTNVNYSALFQTTGSITYQKFGNSSTGVTATDGFDIGVNSSDARLIQIENADIIVNFSKKPYDSVNMKIFSNIDDSELIINLQKFYDLHKDFLISCRGLSFEYDLVQGAGGNVSYKFNDKIIITTLPTITGKII